MTISDQLYLLRLSKVWSMLHHGSAGRVQNKASYVMFFRYFSGSFSLFSIIKFVFSSLSVLSLMRHQVLAEISDQNLSVELYEKSYYREFV